MRGFGAGLVPGRPRPLVPAVADARAGARRRASYQMKDAIPTRITSAPTAIAIALEPVKELLPDVAAVVVAAVGAWVLVATGGLGKPDSGFVPPDKGLVVPPAASAAAGAPTATANATSPALSA